MTEHEKTDEAIETVKAVNPLLVRLNKMPGTTIRLPSKGLFYQNEELDSECVDGEVNIYQMTTTDEIMMRSIDMLFQGTAIESVITRCLPQIKKPMELLVGDIDYILTQLRKVSYGDKIPITYDCDCIKSEAKRKEIEQAGDNEYMIPVDAFIQSTKELDGSKFNQTFSISLKNNQRVVVQPLRYKDFIKIQHMEDKSKSKDIKDIEDFVATNFTSVTMSVDEVTDKDMIKEWYKALPRLETEQIKKKLESIQNWGIEFKYTIKCKQCKEAKELRTQLNPMYFFMLPSSPETK